MLKVVRRNQQAVVVVKAQRQGLKCSSKALGYFTLIGDKAPPAARASSEVARALNQRCYPTPETAGAVGV